MAQTAPDTDFSNRRQEPVSRPQSRAPGASRWLSLLLGLLAAASYALCAATAYLLYPGSFSPLTNTMSELGSPALNPTGSTIYRIGCVLGGACTIGFFLCLGPWRRSGTPRQNRLLLVVQALGVVAGSAMILFAVYADDQSLPHHLLLGILATSFGVAMVLSLVAFWRPGYPNLFRTIVTVIPIAAIALMFAIPGSHWAEWLPPVLSQTFVWVLGFYTAWFAAMHSTARAGESP